MVLYKNDLFINITVLFIYLKSIYVLFIRRMALYLYTYTHPNKYFHA